MKRTPKRGVTESEIREAIEQLVANNQQPTTTSVRAVLGTGSFTTIGTTLTKWREEQEAAAKPPLPTMPQSMAQQFQRLWRDACQAANSEFEAERAGFRADRLAWKNEQLELMTEITQLETQSADLLAEMDQAQLQFQEQSSLITERDRQIAAMQARIESLEAENDRMRQERQQMTVQLAAVSERAAGAEALLSRPAQEVE